MSSKDFTIFIEKIVKIKGSRPTLEYQKTVDIAGLLKTRNIAKELHSSLGVGRDFSTWIRDRIKKINFIQEYDYVMTFAKAGVCKNVKMINYHITLDMAKHLAMLENNDKGIEARKYFIDCE